MTVPSLPARGSSDWYAHYQALDAEARKVVDKLDVTTASATYVAGRTLRPSGDTSGATDLADLNAAITAAAGSEIVLFPGIYYFNGAINLSDAHGTRLLCLGGGETGGAEKGAVLRYVGGPVGRFVDARGLIGGTLSGLVIQGGGTFSGTLVDLAAAQFVNFTDCTLTGQGGATPTDLVVMPDANQITFTRVNFLNAVNGVTGRTAEANQFCEIIRFYDCNFGTSAGQGSLSGYAVRNPHVNWLFSGCNWEPSTTGEPNALWIDPTFSCNGVTFVGCWWGDPLGSYTGTEPWLACQGPNINGIVIIGGKATMSVNSPFITFGGAAGDQYGLVIKGLTATSSDGITASVLVPLGGGSAGAIDISGINYTGLWVAQPVTGVPGQGSIVQGPGGMSVSGVGLVGVKDHAPGAIVTNPLGATEADVDAANLYVTFVTPPSGNVLVRASTLVIADPAADVFFSFREGNTTVPNSLARVLLIGAADEATQVRVTHSVLVRGLTPGSSHTYKLGGYVGGGAASVGQGGVLGESLLEAWAA